jgi:oligopeptide transport system permease protein
MDNNSTTFFEGVTYPELAIYPGQEPYVAPLNETPLRDVDSVDDSTPPTSMFADAWRTLRKNPMFIISAVLILFIVVVALFPSLFTHLDPNYCTLDNFGKGASAAHPFGFDQQGCDVFARTIYGARTSLTVGVVTTLLVILLGGIIGALGGFFGGWVDAVLSRLTDIFFAIPLVLGAIVVLQMFTTTSSIWKVVLVMVLFGWVSIARIARGAVIEAKNLEFNTASVALGSTPGRNLFRHVIPNAIAPVIVTGTTSLATYIVLEATLSFLGIGLPSSVVSWGGDISSAQQLLTTQPAVLLYPAGALVITVLAFILLGDSIKDALDPKSRTE